MNETGRRILADLERVAAERRRRADDAALAARVDAIKRFQHLRFKRTYADLLASPRYSAAAQFFLEDLYGPYDFARRDAQFARVVPGLVRLFSGEVVDTVGDLAALHALSEELDSSMAATLAMAKVDPPAYVMAWRHVGREPDRFRQIALIHAIGEALDRYTRRPLLRHALHLMHGPAHALGLGALQDFLEHGFDTFRALGGAGEFLDLIQERETRLARQLFSDMDVASATMGLGELP